jgi:hypothetical protein
MYELKKIGKLFTSKFVGTGPSSYEKRIYRAVVSQRLRNPTIREYSIGIRLRVSNLGFELGLALLRDNSLT